MNKPKYFEKILVAELRFSGSQNLIDGDSGVARQTFKRWEGHILNWTQHFKSLLS